MFEQLLARLFGEHSSNAPTFEPSKTLKQAVGNPASFRSMLLRSFVGWVERQQNPSPPGKQVMACARLRGLNPHTLPCCAKRLPRLGYFVIIRRDAALGVCSAGDSTNVTQAFQPSGRLSWANSQ